MRRFTDLDELSTHAAESATAVIIGAVRQRGRCAVALSGGHGPQPFYRLLASRFRDQIPWNEVHVFWGDDRYVPHDDPRSNYRMARETLLDHVPCPARNVHPMPTHMPDPDVAAAEYAATLRDFFGDEPPRFDLMLLGLGVEGHTASLFPHSAALRERSRWVVAATVPAEPPVRLTMTLPVLNQSATTFFIVSGPDKADALGHVLSGNADPDLYPAAGVQPDGEVTWWVG